MRGIWNEYAEILIGAFAATAITGMVLKFVLQGGSLYEFLLQFSQNIC